MAGGLPDTVLQIEPIQALSDSKRAQGRFRRVAIAAGRLASAERCRSHGVAPGTPEKRARRENSKETPNPKAEIRKSWRTATAEARNPKSEMRRNARLWRRFSGRCRGRLGLRFCGNFFPLDISLPAFPFLSFVILLAHNSLLYPHNSIL